MPFITLLALAAALHRGETTAGEAEV